MVDLSASMDDNPGFDCTAGRHLFFDIHDQADAVVGGWCPWCGTGISDPDRITDDGLPVGFVPTYRMRIPDAFTRETREEGRG